MSARDRLIELLKQDPCDYINPGVNTGCECCPYENSITESTSCFEELYADHLLKHGVIVPLTDSDTATSYADLQDANKTLESTNLHLSEEFIKLQTSYDVNQKKIKNLESCVAELYLLLSRLENGAKQRDLTLVRVRGGACGCDAYQGLPPICRIFDTLEDKYYDIIFPAIKDFQSKERVNDNEV